MAKYFGANVFLCSVWFTAAAVLISACGSPERETGTAEPSASESQPAHDPEGVPMEDEGRIAAELIAEPDEIRPGESVLLRIVNRGEVPLFYGRPITAEQWDGSQWVETEESRETMWTMDMLHVPAGGYGVEQRWPFHREQSPEPGWYRLTKDVQSEGGDGDPVRLIIRARVSVTK